MSILKASSYALFCHVKYFNRRAHDFRGANLIFISGRANTRRTFLFLSFNNKIFTSFCFALKIQNEFKYSETDSWLSMKSKYLFIYIFFDLFIYLFICSFFCSFSHSFLYAPNYSFIEWWQMYQLLQTFLCMFFFVITDDFLFHIRVSTQLPFSVVFQKDN